MPHEMSTDQTNHSLRSAHAILAGQVVFMTQEALPMAARCGVRPKFYCRTNLRSWGTKSAQRGLLRPWGSALAGLRWQGMRSWRESRDVGSGSGRERGRARPAARGRFVVPDHSLWRSRLVQCRGCESHRTFGRAWLGPDGTKRPLRDAGAAYRVCWSLPLRQLASRCR